MKLLYSEVAVKICPISGINTMTYVNEFQIGFWNLQTDFFSYFALYRLFERLSFFDMSRRIAIPSIEIARIFSLYEEHLSCIILDESIDSPIKFRFLHDF